METLAGLAAAFGSGLAIGWLCSGVPASNWQLRKAIALGAHLCATAKDLIREVEAYAYPECYEGATGKEMAALRTAATIFDNEYPGGAGSTPPAHCPHGKPWDDCSDCCH
jgi:hypothetical protein